VSEVPGWRLAIHDELASTQDLVLAAAEAERKIKNKEK